MKRDLVEAVRKMGTLAASSSRVELGEGSVGSGSKDKAIRMKRTRSSAEVGGQLRVMETGLVTTSRRYNELKLLADRKAVELQSLLDSLTMIKLEHDALEKMRLRQTPESDRIGTLAREIADATNEIQGKLHYRRVLHHMHQRLEQNKVCRRWTFSQRPRRHVFDGRATLKCVPVSVPFLIPLFGEIRVVGRHAEHVTVSEVDVRACETRSCLHLASPDKEITHNLL